VSTIALIARELAGLFVDDGSLAIAIILVVVLSVLAAGVDAPPLVIGGVLFFGCIVVVWENISRTTRRRS
jgi:hypothetical protein